MDQPVVTRPSPLAEPTSGEAALVTAGSRLVVALRAHPVLAGAGLGLLWGGAMRAWMRFISTNPEFSWSGTSFILAAGAIAGSVLGWARHRRRAGGVGWWRYSALSLGLLGAGGAVMWPSVIAWGIAIGRRRPWWLVSTLLAGGAAVQYPVIDANILSNWRLGTVEWLVATAWYVPMLAVEAWAFSVAFAPAFVATPARWKRVLLAAPLALVAGAAALVVGMPM